MTERQERVYSIKRYTKLLRRMKNSQIVFRGEITTVDDWPAVRVVRKSPLSKEELKEWCKMMRELGFRNPDRAKTGDFEFILRNEENESIGVGGGIAAC